MGSHLLQCARVFSSDGNMDLGSLEVARREIEKLQHELQISETSLKESAEKGLELLEVKSELEDQYEILEAELDRIKNERDALKEVRVRLPAKFLTGIMYVQYTNDD